MLASFLEGVGKGMAEGANYENLRQEKEKFARERNLLAVALAVRNGEFGGYYYADDEDGDEWPVVWAELPNLADGLDERFDRDERLQVSWHVEPGLTQFVEENLPNEEPPRGWDGHSRARKNDRLIEFVERA